MSISGQSDTSANFKGVPLTTEGYAKIKKDLQELRTVKSKEIADYIHEAKEAGDISESSAYEDAKNKQAMLNGEIQRLESILASAIVMTPDMYGTENGPRTVRIGMKVEVETDSGSTRMFNIVSTFEA